MWPIDLYSYSRSIGSEHLSTSAKSGNGVKDLFVAIAESNSLVISQSQYIEILENKKNSTESVPKKKINTRGVLKVDGFNEFDP